MLLRIAAYYGDLGDGIHTGKDDDPRISIIEVIPSEIRYWIATSGSIGRAISTTVGAITGHGSAPGELRTLTSQEVSDYATSRENDISDKELKDSIGRRAELVDVNDSAFDFL